MRPADPLSRRWGPKIAGALMVAAGTLCADLPGAMAGPEAAALSARPSVYLLGDSVFAGLTTGTALDVLRTTYDVTLDARVCRRTDSPSCTASGQTPDTGIEAMRAHRGALGDVLVVGLGYNDDPNRFDAAIDALMAEAVAQHVPQVMWLTMRTERFDVPNTALRAAQARHPTLLVVDWDAASSDHDNWFAADGMHLASGGRTGLAAFIGAQLDHLWLSRCRAGAPVIGQDRVSTPSPDTATGGTSTDAIVVDGHLQLMSPTRVLDTRNGVAAHPLGAGKVLEVAITGAAVGAGSVVPGDAVAAIMNITAADACADGFLSVFPCTSAVPAASNLNVTANGTVANLVTVALSGGRACVYSMVTTDVIVDLAGWYGPTGSTVSPTAPRRIIDTRIGKGLASGAVDAGATVAFDIHDALPPSTTAEGVAINITATQPDGDGFITAFPCGRDRPTASNVNYTTGQSISNMAMVPVAVDGRVCFFTHARTHLVVDVFAVIGASDTTTTATVTVRSPNRIVDTRIGLGTSSPTATGPLPALRELTVHADDATGTATALAVLNVTAVHPNGDGWLAAHPCGTTAPEISNLNFLTDSITAGHVVVAVGTSGSVCITSMVSTDVVVDLIGWSRATPTATTAAATSTAAGLRRLFSRPAIGRGHCSTRQDPRQSGLPLPAVLDRHQWATPWHWPIPPRVPVRCRVPA